LEKRVFYRWVLAGSAGKAFFFMGKVRQTKESRHASLSQVWHGGSEQATHRQLSGASAMIGAGHEGDHAELAGAGVACAVTH
jgi:hypothetical protein